MHTLFDLTWMAWTWPTAAFFLAVGLSVAAIGVWERLRPSGMPSRGVFGLDTTRGDRLFISWLGTGFIHMGWLGLVGTPLWAPLGLSLAWWLFVFRWV